MRCRVAKLTLFATLLCPVGHQNIAGAGIAFQEERAAAAAKGSSRRASWWAILLALLGIAFLLVKTLIERRL
jgi:hypothetical protein